MDGIIDKLAGQFSQTNSQKIGQAIEELVNGALMRRRGHERRWYDNNFFDDGYHFRTISRKTGRIIDHTSRSTGYVERAIPRASRQIRAVSNLLFAAEPYPVVYPERISSSEFPPPQKDPRTGKEVPSPEYEKAMEQAKDIARRRGIWLTTEWDEKQQLPLKLIDMMLLAAKNSVSWIEVYSDTNTQEICTDVFDAFDVICYGDLRDYQKLPFITKTQPMDIEDIKTDYRFKEEMVQKLTPDNRYATSEIKDAYMRARFGAKTPENKEKGTLIVKETFLQEFLGDDNWQQAVKLGSETGAMEGKSKGDKIMRQVFSAGGITLNDEYVDYDKYPLVPFRFEPGSLYQVPFIERFIPQNKSLDVIVTRLEKWVNAMVVGVYQKRKGENFQVSNFPGGQLIDYETTPLTQMNVASVGNTPFNMVEILNRYMDEQGATTAGGQNLPTGVKSGVAIESVKATEYANLKIATLMLKQTIKEIAERMLERAHKDFLKPVEVQSIEDGEPNYFDIIGQRGFDLSKKVNKKLPQDVVTINKDTKVRIEIEPGLGLTMEGKRQAMESIIEYILKLTQAVPGVVTPEALQQIIKRFLETFGYGSTQELMEAMEEGLSQAQLTEDQITQMKIAVAEVMKDLDMTGQQFEGKMVDTTKVGVLEALKQSGIADKIINSKEKQPQQKQVSESLSYKDAPEDIKRQIEMQAGLTPSKGISPAGTDQIVKHQEVAQGAAQAERDHAVKTVELGQKAADSQSSTQLAREKLKSDSKKANSSKK